MDWLLLAESGELILLSTHCKAISNAAVQALATHHVLAIQPCGLDRTQEELGPVSVGSGIGHR